MSKLSDLVTELGEKALELEDGFSLFERLKNNDIDNNETLRTLEELSIISVEFSDLLIEAGVILPLPEHFIHSKNYHSYLALALVDHDLRDFSSGYAMEVATLILYQKKERDFKSEFSNEELFIYYENLRVGLNTIGLIATGDEKFVSEISRDKFAGMLQNITDDNDFSCDLNGVETICTDVYFDVIQMIKNAKKSLYHAKDLFPDNVDTNIRVSFKEHNPNLTVSVRDNATGIPQEILPKIFGNYTSRDGTAVGLQVVKRIADLRDGYIEVVSTTQGNETYKYDTRSGKVEKYDKQEPRGTTFKLYIPK